MIANHAVSTSTIDGIRNARLREQRLAYEAALRKIIEMPSLNELENYIGVIEDELEKLNQLEYIHKT